MARQTTSSSKSIISKGFKQYTSHTKKTSCHVYTQCKPEERQKNLSCLNSPEQVAQPGSPPQILVLANNFRIPHALPVADMDACLGRTPNHLICQTLGWCFCWKPRRDPGTQPGQAQLPVGVQESGSAAPGGEQGSKMGFQSSFRTGFAL